MSDLMVERGRHADTQSPVDCVIVISLGAMSYSINIHCISLFCKRPTLYKVYQTIDTHLCDPVTQLVGRTQFQECSSGFLVCTGTKV